MIAGADISVECFVPKARFAGFSKCDRKGLRPHIFGPGTPGEPGAPVLFVEACVATGGGTSAAIIPLKPTKGLNGAPSICYRSGKDYGVQQGLCPFIQWVPEG